MTRWARRRRMPSRRCKRSWCGSLDLLSRWMLSLARSTFYTRAAHGRSSRQPPLCCAQLLTGVAPLRWQSTAADVATMCSQWRAGSDWRRVCGAGPWQPDTPEPVYAQGHRRALQGADAAVLSGCRADSQAHGLVHQWHEMALCIPLCSSRAVPALCLPKAGHQQYAVHAMRSMTGVPAQALTPRCCHGQGELACGLLVRDQAHKETISFALQFGTSATWRVVAIPDDQADEPYVIHEYSQEDFAEIHRRATWSRISCVWKIASRPDQARCSDGYM